MEGKEGEKHKQNKQSKQKKKSWKSWLLDLVFPPKCPFCRALVEDSPGCCSACRGTLPWRSPEAFDHPSLEVLCYAPLWYGDPVAGAMHRYKFQGVQSYAQDFGHLMAEILPEDLAVDWITWAPLHPRRQRQRGYDQAKLLALAVGEERGWPVKSLLVKTRHTDPQSGLEEAESRRRNASGAYAFSGESVAGRRILLVDDVLTSGATLGTCATLLKDQGAEEVFCLTLVRARK